MGMTIEDAILCLKGIKQYGSDTFTKRSQDDWQNSLDTAIETMRKYQKIKEQVDIAIDKENYAISGARLIQIREIINGNED